MVGDQYVAGFTIQTDGAKNTISVVGTLNDKTEINGDALIALSCGAGVFFMTGRALEFGILTDRTVVEVTGGSELGYAVGIQMSLTSTAMMKMAETVVPEKAELIAAKVAKPICRGLINFLMDSW